MKIFIDTSVLLNSFLIFRKFESSEIDGNYVPLYLKDSENKLYIFEKSKFEAYMAFKGIGGKKPSEGRGDYANRFLKNVDDPISFSKIISKYHGDNKELAYYWSNQILEIDIESLISKLDFVKDEDRDNVLKNIEKLRQLKSNRDSFEKLCSQFNRMLDNWNIEVLSYFEIFSFKNNESLISFESPFQLDQFAKDTAIPSEDFEIIFAAERIGADIFLTNDNELINCSMSLGNNYFLSPTAFCRSEDYETLKEKIKLGKDYRELK
ncbi:hypothetical protein Ctha_1014 [Chloroherpeton thalassium ATCC 35110]|uniref:Uncharacterized protein n=1 Tax=Chloroherpeton thalassium (strain ATCC 35110 / GB-78) TaxID=517418 RepID=B3QXV1_CHLT3|nr:hypothetical protein [Chloroherpeton thalassium]ACF13479.1 hypothetical protein Ctha_1014 [Chloroherpeton thalassium ATCC 35110]